MQEPSLKGLHPEGLSTFCDIYPMVVGAEKSKRHYRRSCPLCATVCAELAKKDGNEGNPGSCVGSSVKVLLNW